MADTKAVPNFKWLDAISRTMDSKFRLPGTKFTFGLDPLLGLIPFAGDITAFAISGSLVLYMVKYGVSRKVIILMILNVVVDTIIGSIPLLGNIFDFAFKANDRNIKLLKKHYQEGKYQGKGNEIIIAVAIALLLILGLLAFAFYKAAIYLIDLL